MIARYLLSVCSSIRHTRFLLPYSGSFGLSFATFPIKTPRPDPRYYDPLRLPTALLGVLRYSLVPRYLFPVSVFFVSPTGLTVWCDTSPAGARGISIPVPLAGPRSGYGWISPVPRLPLYPHALVSGPGGVAHTRLIACETTAFRGLQLVGFPPLRGLSSRTTTLHISGLNTRPADSLHPASDTPSRRSPSGSLLACWLSFGSVGFALLYSPTG